MVGAGKTGHRVMDSRPPAKLFLGIAIGCLVVNHLSVIFGNGIVSELLVAGSWTGLIGGWVLLAGPSFDAVTASAKPSAWRTVVVVGLAIVVPLGVAEAIAWFGYGQHLVG